jgi:DNA-directed RNA polymerase specialized sigma subunit
MSPSKPIRIATSPAGSSAGSPKMTDREQLERALRGAEAAVRAAEHRAEQLRVQRDVIVRAALAEGMTQRAVRDILGVSRARVNQIDKGTR